MEEWSVDNKNSCDEFEVYKYCAYILVSTTCNNHANLVAYIITTDVVDKENNYYNIS